ncbi:MAG: 50S ribosomal protein L11 methyltransferase [Spirochaetes bacterium]|jgi:ribosomal protein L11 methylase PrmA|nr:50S ribosomal protein L11 methyltransferase [Spirochaetota bacterium]
MFELKIKVKKEISEVYESALFDGGASSVSLSPDMDDTVVIVALFFDKDKANRLLAGLGRDVDGAVNPVCPDYSDRWLDYVDSEELSDCLTVCKIDQNPPPVEELKHTYGENGRRHVVGIDARKTFGIGIHPTSRLCVTMLEKSLEYVSPEKSRCADIGCGSGILAIFASKLGFAEVVACDNSPEACRMTELNSRYNKCDVQVVNCRAEDFSEGLFDLLVANIPISLVELSVDALSMQLNTCGYLVLSGFGLKWKDYVSSLFIPGFSIVSFDENGDWGGYIMKKER